MSLGLNPAGAWRCAGEPEALVSEPVPADASGELAAEAAHVVVLPAHVRISDTFSGARASGATAGAAAVLSFEVPPENKTQTFTRYCHRLGSR